MATDTELAAILRDGASRLLSDCVESQAVCHFLLSLRMALRMVRSFLATAMRATILGLPGARRRCWKVRSAGFERIAVIAAMNRAVRTLARPPPMKLLPHHLPDWRGERGRTAAH